MPAPVPPPPIKLIGVPGTSFTRDPRIPGVQVYTRSGCTRGSFGSHYDPMSEDARTTTEALDMLRICDGHCWHLVKPASEAGRKDPPAPHKAKKPPMILGPTKTTGRGDHRHKPSGSGLHPRRPGLPPPSATRPE